MRKELSKIEGERGRFTATISKLGKKTNFRGLPSETVLFTNVSNERGEKVTDHVWFTIGKKLSCVFGNIGKQVSFEARVASYTKGYKGKGLEMLKPKEIDYRLSIPTNVQILKT